ncbi:MAG: ComEC family competence protein [Geminicoccaceae bacterium]|nr:MAG: ComEC family competence protein [Geminicoccaceae bacterium]
MRVASDSTIETGDPSAGRRWRWPSMLARLGAALAAERPRWFLGLPIALACGIALYHGLAFEPPRWWGFVAASSGIAVGLLAFWLGHPGRRALGFGVAVLFAGFALAQHQAHRLDQPTVAFPQVAVVTGWVELVEPRDDGARLTLRVDTLEGVRGGTPERLRITARTLPDALHVGDKVRARARFMPPSEPVMPGAFDFARWAHFQGLGAVGYVFGEVERLEAATARDGWRIAELRRWIASHVVRVVPGDAGAVAAAVMTGLRGDIPEHVWLAMQGSGLAHLLAISGLHVGLVAGTAFLVVRFGICLFPWLAVRVQAHRLAAFAGLLMAFVYLLLAGATIPTQRAFFMTAVVLLALMLDREAISLRLVALAATVILVIDPAALYGASFQMSFAAVVGLVAAYERWRWQRHDRDAGAPGLLLAYVVGVLVTTLIATVVTTPFAAYHFGRIPTYGVLANLVAVPLMAFWIMPLALVSLVLMPLGLDALVLGAMSRGIDLVLWSAATTSAWPMAAFDVPQPSGWAIALVSLAALWAVIWRGPVARLALLPACVALAAFAFERPPDLVVDRAAGMVAMRGSDGRYALAVERRDGFVLRGWTRALGIDDFAEPVLVAGVACDERGCRLARRSTEVAIALRPGALALDCTAGAALVINLSGDAVCADTPTITRSELWSRGAVAVHVGPTPRVRFVHHDGQRRLWQRQR